MKKILFTLLLLGCLTTQAQFNAIAKQMNKDCTKESVLNEPGRFFDAHVGGAVGGAKQGFTPIEIANSKKMMQAIENICKPKLQFTGGLAKASFGLKGKAFYNQQSVYSYTYNLGFHEFVCNVQTKKLAIVDEYLGVLRVTGNPDFRTLDYAGLASREYLIPTNTTQQYAPAIALFNYYPFSDSRVVQTINNGYGFIDLTDEAASTSAEYQVVEYKPGKGYGITFNSGFSSMSNSFVYRHAYITHTDIPYFIPITRKKYLTDLLEYYEREQNVLAKNMQVEIDKFKKSVLEMEKNNNPYLQNTKDKLALIEQSAREIPAINQQKKQTVTKLLQSKDENWLSQQAVLPYEHQRTCFAIPYERNRNMNEVYGKFYFTEFYTGTKGLHLYQINPEYVKKYPPNAAKPSLIRVMYRFSPGNRFLMGVNDSFINKLDLKEFRKLIE